MTQQQIAINAAVKAGVPLDQMSNFFKAGIALQPKQLEFAAAARACDKSTGPVLVATGGARGGGKTTALIAQLAADDAQRMAGLKGLWIRKVGKANIEHLDDLRRTILRGLPHKFNRSDGTLAFANGSRIICGHYQNEGDIDAYLGLEYDVIAVEEATTLTEQKFRNIRTCCRSSKSGWRPRVYLTANPGGVGHGWMRKMFVLPRRTGCENETRFIPSTCMDNAFNNKEYVKVLQSLTGWQRRAWLEGDWDIAAGQYFVNWREDVHVLPHFDDKRAVLWFCSFDYGFRHWTACHLFAVCGDGIIVCVDEHKGRNAVPEWHVQEIKKMLSRHSITSFNQLQFFVAGSDIFGTESDGGTVSSTYANLGMHMTCAETDRLNGWGEIARRLGDVDRNIKPTVFVTRNCPMLIEQIPYMEHDPNKPDDVLKVDCDDEGNGGDDFIDGFRYGIASYKGTKICSKAQALGFGAFGGSSL